MTNFDLLRAICENPGWRPPEIADHGMDGDLRVLEAEGWILARADGGWEATPRAVAAHPLFETVERDEQARPIYPQREESWDSTFTPPRLVLSGRQRIEAPLDLGELRGAFQLARAEDVGGVEVEITIRVRKL